ncbi:MAG: UDP-N-acetylmuramoyl-tripeptide--D-alanyl-D-alanine ligase [Planctomycetota bacterium]|jgi:UDP-N-acetylmuramoyl-tripeptide--D-alanyl-D-alanine ligase
MTFWNLSTIRDATTARCVARGSDGNEQREIFGLSTDTRTLKPGQVYAALRGENFDGHDFIEQAIDAGSPLILIDRLEAAEDIAADRFDVLLVNNTYQAIARLATAYRKTFGAKVVAITGSTGKTTTKTIVHHLLGSKLTGSASIKSFNNHIGVPLTLLNARPNDDYVIAEVGTNAPGEIAQLAKIVQPDIAVITNVGPVHLEGLGSVEGILREKASLLSHLTASGLAIVNADVEGLTDYGKITPGMVSFGFTGDADLRITDYHAGVEISSFTLNDRWELSLPLLGRHNALNATAAIAVARHLKFTENEIAIALAGTPTPDSRLKPQRVGPEGNPVTLIDDAYNASPDSMAAALGILGDFPTRGRRIAILGDMLELGELSEHYHRQLGRRAAESGADLAIFIGHACEHAAAAFASSRPPEQYQLIPDFDDQTPERVAACIEAGDTVLIKASRSMQLERLIPSIRLRFETAGAPKE